MKFFKNLLFGLIGLIVVFMVVGAFLPSTYNVERKVTISASIADIHPLVNDLKRWPEWGPWKDGDPTIEITLGPVTEGKGASQMWKGVSGTGQLAFTASDPAKGVEYDLIFDDAFSSKAVIAYQAGGQNTDVTWSMSGDTGWNIIGRYFVLMMDSQVGPMFDSGLRKLKGLAEAK